MTTWLIVDGNNLAWRSHHAMKGLAYQGKSTAVLYGFLRDTIAFRRKFKADNCVFCFDKGRSLRTKLCPSYKGNRLQGQTADLEEHARERAIVYEQLFDLELILPAAGFKNILSQQGYEADDLIASVCHGLSPDDEAVVLGSDRDLLQLLSGPVSIWNYREHVTLQSFWAEWKLEPDMWVDVKALAGCRTDGIKGIQGVGELTAARFLRNELTPGKTLDKILAGTEVWGRNRQLVELPWPGLKPFFLREDVPDPKAWDRICGEHGMDSLRGMLSKRMGMVK